MILRSIGASHIALLFLTTVLVACSSEPPAWKQNRFVEVDLSRQLTQTTLPKGLWTKIVAVLHGESKNPQVDESARQEPLPSIFAPLKVYMIEKNRGILARGNTVVDFSAGGGELDLSDFIRTKNGSFHFAIEFLPEMEDVKRHVFFMSGGIQRRIGREIVGAGCDTYFDISKAFSRAMKKEGFFLNTSEGRHISALAGTYFFAAAKSGKLYLAALNVKDSAQRALQCGI